MKAEITGIEQAQINLAKILAGVKVTSKRGLIASALEVLGKALPITPIEFGNLRNSGYVVWEGGKTADKGFVDGHVSSGATAVNIKKSYDEAIAEAKANVGKHAPAETKVELGFGAYYAVYVHEAENKHKSPTGRLFLKIAVDSSRGAILKHLGAKIKKV